MLERYTKLYMGRKETYEIQRGTKTYHQFAINKLGKVEDKEQELGITIETYFEIFKHTHIWFVWFGSKVRCLITGINTTDKVISIYHEKQVRKVAFSGYGRIWGFEKGDIK